MQIVEPYRWTSWQWTRQCAALKWEYRGNAYLWHAMLHEITDRPPSIVWRGTPPNANTAPGVIGDVSLLKPGYCICSCMEHSMLSAIQAANAGERCLLLDIGEHGMDWFTVPMLEEVFSLPDSVSPERALREGWEVAERPMVDILDVPVASLLFWDADFVDTQSKRHSMTELDTVFQGVTERLGVSLLRDDEL